MGYIRRQYRTLMYMFRRLTWRVIRDNITVYSAAATFFLVLSSLPFAMIIISLLRFLLPDAMSPLWNTFFQMLPEELKLFFLRFLNELLHTSTSSVVSFSLLISLWAASKGIMGLELGMHVIYRNNPRGNYLQRRLRCTLYTLIFVLAIFFAILMLIFGSTIVSMLEARIPFLVQISGVVTALRIGITFVIFIVVFTLGYKYLTGTRMNFFQRLPGVLFSTFGWLGFSYIFSIYIDNFSNYTYLYGSLGALLLLFLWLYFCMIILLGGAEINMLIRDWRHGDWKFWVDPEDVIRRDRERALAEEQAKEKSRIDNIPPEDGSSEEESSDETAAADPKKTSDE